VAGDPVTVSGTAGEVEGLSVAGSVGVNTAVSWWGPGASRVVDPAAVPLLLTVTAGPMLVVPSWNCTVPTAVEGVIVAVSVTGEFWAATEAGEVTSMVLVCVALVVCVVVLVAVPLPPAVPALFAVPGATAIT
jgi:hypothetical protein